VIELSAPEGPPVSGARGESLTAFAGRCGLDLLRFAYLTCGDRQRAEDLLQDVLFAMYRRFGETLPLANPQAYAHRAIVHANVSRVRRRSSHELPAAVLPDLALPAPDDPTDRDALWQALRRLPERQRAVLVMRFYLDATDDDIATTLGCRRGTVRSLASRGLAAMRTDPAIEGGVR
jgi:RNA polymerase sigma-70 factor (sigma-E family)